jgi:hypothetical protein
MEYCRTASPDWSTFKRSHPASWFRSVEDDGSPIKIGIRFAVIGLPTFPESRVGRALGVLNRAFSNENSGELERIPDTERYPWRRVLGNANIRFVRSGPTEHFAEAREEASGPVDLAAATAGVRAGVLNVYIAEFAKWKTILGQAQLGSNVVYVLASTLGDESAPGALQRYGLSKTLVHETGHALSLPHTFSDDACDYRSVFPDVPEQVTPNFDTELFVGPDGRWECRGDHRWRARHNSAVKGSCLSLYGADSPNEMGVNYMDYGDDSVSIMFTRSQAAMMRYFARSSGLFFPVVEESVEGPVEGPVECPVEGPERSSGSTTVVVVVLVTVLAAAVLLKWWASRRYGR